MKWIIPLLALIMSGPSIIAEESASPAPVRSWSGQQSGVNNSESIVVRSQEELTALWTRIHANVQPKPTVPKVDFSKSIVVASFMGARTTGGFSVKLGDPGMKNGELAVPIITKLPTGMVTQATTSPWAARVIDVEDPKVKVRFFKKAGGNFPRPKDK